MTVKYWSCPKCGARHPRLRQRCGEAVRVWSADGVEYCDGRRPKPRVRKHARTLRDDPYALYVDTARAIHGVTDESCCACGKPRTQERHHDRDHDHRTGQRRGLLCGGNQGCNVLLLPYHTAAVTRALAEALEREAPAQAPRWFALAAYLERVEAWYANVHD